MTSASDSKRVPRFTLRPAAESGTTRQRQLAVVRNFRELAELLP